MSGMFRNKKYLHIKGRQEERQTVICPSCQRESDRAEVVENNYICMACGSYFRIRTKNRLRMVCDKGSFTPWFEEIESGNPLQFPGYEEKLSDVREKTGLKEGVTVGEGSIYGERVCLGICDSRFLMGSMWCCFAAPAAPGCRREFFP